MPSASISGLRSLFAITVVGLDLFLRLRLCLPLRLEFEFLRVGEERFSSPEELESRLVSSDKSLNSREGHLSSGIEGSLLETTLELDVWVREALLALTEADEGADVALDFSCALAVNRRPTVLVVGIVLEVGLGTGGTLNAHPKVRPGTIPAALEFRVRRGWVRRGELAINSVFADSRVEAFGALLLNATLFAISALASSDGFEFLGENDVLTASQFSTPRLHDSHGDTLGKMMRVLRARCETRTQPQPTNTQQHSNSLGGIGIIHIRSNKTRVRRGNVDVLYCNFKYRLAHSNVKFH
ncbi:hypothetical protein FA13DRAFT_1713980 [Coprinellus micaceus]|uniref:Uncharacterized protein n=1 Tax=Coprinellus micaceus TaxID=71717 RepID=A0A4Y7SU70_COPMI|nr:hypothetical protein FA13DRAFT_1713980 [Coprinellus micaceus]